jgi:general stress protein 26
MDKQITKLLKNHIAFAGSAEINGQPYIKAMLVNHRKNNVFYFDSNNSSVRVTQWAENPKACVYFYAAPFYKGVMLTGVMEIINDLDLKKKHWKPSMKFVYSGVDDPDYCILKFTAKNGRYYEGLKSTDFTL